jgi:tetratricopeptide (TPR) repeat protein
MTPVAAMVLGWFAANSFAADNVAPTRAELEEMYNAAYKAFDSKKFSEALKQLDAIDARQPDLAASKNLRGVILMRQGNYDQAEAALQEAARIDPKFWNAGFNLAEIPFLKKDWPEARKRFEQLLSTGGPDLAKDSSQLIQYKILLTYLMEGKGNMVDSILAKLELSPDTPAVDYVKAAVALQQKNQNEAKDWTSAAGKNFSPQLNKLFAESLYEIGLLERPAGEGRPSLPLKTAAERSQETKVLARSKFEQSQQAFRQRDFVTALKLMDQADQADPNQPATLNLRGEILMQQQQFDQAEAAFKKAAKLDPKFREAQYNLAQIPFKKKDYAKAQERFEALYKQTPGGDKNQAAELIKFKIYMTLLMEGKESRAHSMMEEFQFTGDTPALYYAQAAWEYKHNNPEKAADWTGSANKIYSPALNSVFADAFYDVGWMQRPEGSTAPAVAFDTTNVGASQGEGGPAVEPSPIPDRVFAANKQRESSKGEALALAPAGQGQNTGMELAGAQQTAGQPATSLSSEPAAETNPQAQQSVSESPAGASESTTAAQPVAAETANASSASNAQNNKQTPVQTSPSEKSAVAAVAAKVSSLLSGERRMWIVGGLLFAGLLLLALVIVPVVRWRFFKIPRHLRLEPPPGAAEADSAIFKPRVAPAQTSSVQGNGFVGGPRQISAQLQPWKPAVRHTALPPAELSGAFERSVDFVGKSSQAPAYREAKRDGEMSPLTEPVFESLVEPVVKQTAETLRPSVPQTPEIAPALAPSEVSGPSKTTAEERNEIPEGAEKVTPPAVVTSAEPEVALVEEGQPKAYRKGEPDGELSPPSVEPAVEQTAETLRPSVPQTPEIAPALAVVPMREAGRLHDPSDEEIGLRAQAIFERRCRFGPPGNPDSDWREAKRQLCSESDELSEISRGAEEFALPAVVTSAQSEVGSIEQGEPMPYEMTVTAIESPAAEAVTEPVSDFSNTILTEPGLPQPNTPAIMPETTPLNKPPSTSMVKPQPHGPVQKSVHVAFSFEIAAIQLTPSFKMGCLKVRPASNVVTMRLARSENQQPASNSQVSFEVANVQPVAGTLGAIRVTPSQQPRLTTNGSPSFAAAGLQVVPNFEAAPIQLTSSQPEKAIVLVTVPCGISTVEFSPTFEIASVVLNSNSKQVFVQLPSAGAGPAERAPMFEIANLELGESGNIAMMQLNLLGGPKLA